MLAWDSQKRTGCGLESCQSREAVFVVGAMDFTARTTMPDVTGAERRVAFRALVAGAPGYSQIEADFAVHQNHLSP